MLEYTIVESGNTADFVHSINLLLEEGWDLKGDIIIRQATQMQAMTRARGKKWTN